MEAVDYNKLPWEERRDVRNRYVEHQNGCCHHCKQPLDGPPDKIVSDKWVNKKLFPKTFFEWPVHLHHNHKTGMTIGAVHNYCNAVLWQYHKE